MNYEWLFAFTAFAENLNFTHTAQQLHVSQPALHTQIKKLTELVGFPLYQKKGRSLTLTSKGRMLAAFGREIQGRDKAVLAEIQGTNHSRPVVLASGQGAFLYLLGDAIAAFPKEKWPLKVKTLNSSQTLDAVRDAAADVGVAVLESQPTDLSATPIAQIGQKVILPQTSELAARKRLRAKDLNNKNIIVAPSGSPHRTLISHALRLANVQWNVAVETSGWELMMHFAKSGLGITVVNAFCKIPKGMAGIPITDMPPVSYYVITRKNSTHPGAEKMLALIIQSTKDRISWD